jgi:hypothetical protein
MQTEKKSEPYRIGRFILPPYSWCVIDVFCKTLRCEQLGCASDRTVRFEEQSEPLIAFSQEEPTKAERHRSTLDCGKGGYFLRLLLLVSPVFDTCTTVLDPGRLIPSERISQFGLAHFR